MSYKTLLYDLDEKGVALVTLNRPDVLNAVNMEMRLDFTAIMDEIFFNTAV
jgi:enoyl-CoA hydratase/carnithine racemase